MTVDQKELYIFIFMKKLVFLSLYLLSLASCKSRDLGPVLVPTDTTYVDIKGKSYKLLGKIPDSLRTPEQEKYLKRLVKVALKYTVVKNNHQLFKLDRSSFLKMGLSKYDWRLLQQGMIDNNTYIDANGTKNVKEMFEKAKAEANTNDK